MPQQPRVVGKPATTVSTGNDGVMRVTYYSTPVVSVYPNGRIDLNHGGYMTATTKTRMNQAARQFGLGFKVWQKGFDWFVDIDGKTLEFNSRIRTIRNGS